MWYDFFNDTKTGIRSASGELLGVSFFLADASAGDEDANTTLYSVTKRLIGEFSVDAVLVAHGSGMILALCFYYGSFESRCMPICQ